ncbi:hypothetical protein FPQ18DRAFT_282981 [Pyronema domesticum]|uniref:Uncharacterized protein n=1 Tax=Pyronema omphalodes (strain CBS 100304) TaxID=1076935 RepID=U4L089_PYROM|nr:hypothetical protein FPQ18DRAFT_282981 [Pyronema domesticum]CCX07959.1 Similar to hypothetical protein [Tuber melanosporum Mel28]; acc. no. XP_002841348 [Pyronema omphalodes CBS 100304]
MKTTAFSLLALAAMALSAALPEPLANAVPYDYAPTCPVNECNPDPRYNKCDITTSCIRTQPNSQLHCACRDGYKSKYDAGNTSKHYRTKFAGQESRVFVAPGVKCDTLCNEWWAGVGACKEVQVVEQCS